MKCPFDAETELFDMVHGDLAKELEKNVAEFKLLLPPTLQKRYSKIDDDYNTLATKIQHETLKKYYCPSCKLGKHGCP